MAFVYALTDHRNPGVYRYIGVTSNTKTRLSTHIKLSKNGNSPKDCWIRSMAKDGIAPTVVILIEFESNSDAYEYERHLISLYFSNKEHLLTNIQGGGKSNYKVSDDTKSKIRQCYYERKSNGNQFVHNKPHSQEAKDLIRAKNKGKCPPNKGKEMSYEQKVKLSEALRGRKAWNSGVSLSDKHKDNLSAAWEKRKLSHPIREDTKRLLSEKTKRYWELKKQNLWPISRESSE